MGVGLCNVFLMGIAYCLECGLAAQLSCGVDLWLSSLLLLCDYWLVVVWCGLVVGCSSGVHFVV